MLGYFIQQWQHNQVCLFHLAMVQHRNIEFINWYEVQLLCWEYEGNTPFPSAMLVQALKSCLSIAPLCDWTACPHLAITKLLAITFVSNLDV
jgi:hypothetical protein